jgi:hypothetical protein
MMKGRLFTPCSVFLAVPTLIACGEDETKLTSNLDAKTASNDVVRPAASLQVTDQREIRAPRGRILSLSPNGEWLATYKSGRQLCVNQVASGTEQS